MPISTESNVVGFIPTNDVPSRVSVENYYAMMNSYIHSHTSRMAISVTEKNSILVYKVDRNTNRVIDSG